MANYEITIRLNKKEMPRFKEKFGEMVMKEAGPKVVKAIKDIFLYKNMEPGTGKGWGDFLASSAGVLPAAIMQNIQNKYINHGAGTSTGVQLRSIAKPKGEEIIIKAELSKEASTKFVNYNPEAIMRIISRLDPSTAKAIFERAVEKAGLD